MILTLFGFYGFNFTRVQMSSQGQIFKNLESARQKSAIQKLNAKV